MTPLLDRLARTIAAATTGDDAEDRYARDALLRRGFAGALALSTLGSLIGAPKATAATCPKGSLDNCIRVVNNNFRQEVVNTCDNESSFAAKFECLRESHDFQRNQRRACERRCPKPKRPPSSAQKRRRSTPPPTLPPNPYDDGGLCADCPKANNGHAYCCWGGDLPGGYCGCAPVGSPCSAIGCP